MVRNRINIITGSNKDDKLWLNPFITSIFYVVYIPAPLEDAGFSWNEKRL